MMADSLYMQSAGNIHCQISLSLSGVANTSTADSSMNQGLFTRSINSLKINISQVPIGGALQPSVKVTEIPKSIDEAEQTLYKQAYGVQFAPILMVYKIKVKNGKNLKGILKNIENMTEAQKVTAKSLKIVKFDFKHHSDTQLQVVEDRTITDKDLRRSPRMQKKLKGYKDMTSRMQAKQPGMEYGPSNMVEPLVKGNMFFHFPGLVKFPTLTELNKCQKPYPFIHACSLQTVAMHQCNDPLEEVTLELLEAPTQAEDEGKDGGSDGKLMVINEQKNLQ